MNRYIVALNENGLGKLIKAGVKEKLIETEATLEGRTRWTVQSMPYLDEVKTIAEQVEINLAQELAEKEALKENYLKQADQYIKDKYGDCLVQIFPTATGEKSLIANSFVLDVQAHALATCNAIDNDEPYTLGLTQFTCAVTAQEILAENVGV